MPKKPAVEPASYEQALEGFSVNDMAHTLHYLLKMLDNMQRIDTQRTAVDEGDGQGGHEG